MPLGSSTYLDPGVYISQRIQPGSVAITSERVLCLVGIAPRTRRASDEAIVRGKVYDEALTAWTGSTPFLCVLANPSNRDRNQAKLFKNGVDVALGSWSFIPAYLQGNAWSGASISPANPSRFTLSVDGKVPLNIVLTAGTYTGAALVVAINAALVASPNYGAAYSAVASDIGVATPRIKLTSPSSTSASDVKVFLSSPAALDVASTISNAGWAPTDTAGIQADTYVEVSDSVYSATATWTIEYVSVDVMTDPLVEASADTDLSQIIRAGSYPGASTYTKDTDFEEDFSNELIDWSLTSDAQATFTGVNGTFNIATNTKIKISINGITPLEITLTTGSPTATSANVATDINAALVASSNYGPLYGHVASASGAAVKLLAPSPFANYPTIQFASSSITFYEPSSLNATLAIFGIAAASLPYEVFGVGSKPAFGSTYYCSYDYDRPTTDFDTAWRCYNADQLYDYTSPLTADNYTVNHLAIAGEIAFENGAPSIWVCQVNDSTAPGSPTQNQIQAAIDVCEEHYGITEVIVVSPPSANEEALAVYTMNHVSNMSSQTEKKYRRGWFGMPRTTAVGDPDTPDTFVYRAKRTLQPGNTSPGRGRLILCAPSEVSRTLVLEDATEVTVDLDGSYLAAANAALFTSLASPADAMLGRQLVGFLTDSTFETYLQGERYTLAGNGVNVATLDSGQVKLLDPLTTEAGGSVEFQEPSSSAQKDFVTKSITTLLDSNVKGIVPDDLTIFIVTIKTWIASGINAAINAGAIAPFRSSSGTVRDIDLSTDIQVYQDTSDPRTFVFKYWFNLKYVAKRFFGEYSVDNPFFGA